MCDCGRRCAAVPGNMPLSLHQQVNVFNPPILGVVQSLRQVLFQIRLKVLLCLLTLWVQEIIQMLHETSPHVEAKIKVHGFI